MKRALRMGLMTVVLAASANVWAGVERFNSDDFNAIINENLQAEKDLREQLRVNAGVPDVKKEMNPNFAEKGREIVGVVGAENVAAPTTDHGTPDRQNPSKKAYERNLKRVAEEMKAADAQ